MPAWPARPKVPRLHGARWLQGLGPRRAQLPLRQVQGLDAGPDPPPCRSRPRRSPRWPARTGCWTRPRNGWKSGSTASPWPATCGGPRARTALRWSCSSRAWTRPRKSSSPRRTSLLARGMATFSLDGPGQGETGYASTLRPDFEAPPSPPLSMCWAAGVTSTAAGPACWVSARAATSPPGPPRSSPGSGPWSSPAGRMTTGRSSGTGPRTASRPSPTTAGPPPRKRRTRSPRS